jgi:hypothetical protein
VLTLIALFREEIKNPMLILSLATLSLAAVLGLALALLHMRPAGLPQRWPGAVHGTLGALGFLALLSGARASAHGAAEGVGSFGDIAAVLLALALAAGLTVLVLLRRGRRGAAGVMIALHATVAILGYVILATYVSLR